MSFVDCIEEKIQLKDLHNLFDVRTMTKADEDQVLRLVDYIQAEEPLRPVLVTPVTSLPKDFDGSHPSSGWVIIDGRHTISAYEYLGKTEIVCRIQLFKSYADMFAAGLFANYTPNNPNTRKDNRDTIRKLIILGKERDEIAEILVGAGFSKKVAWNMTQYAFQSEARDRQKTAERAVKSGKLTIEEAAKVHHVHRPALERRVNASSKYDISKFRSTIGSITKTYIASVGKEYRRLQENDLTPREEEDTNALIKDLQWRVGRGVAGLIT